MPDHHDYQANARNLAIDILRKERVVTPELIREIATKAVQAMAPFAPTGVDEGQLVAELLHLFSVSVGQATALDDPTEHRPWLPDRRSQVQWRFSNRYMTYLDRDFGMPPASAMSLDNLTDMVLARLEDPQRLPPWDRRGMVVGSVQSGKTANYIGLICKALDAGYKLVVILAGVHNNLRAQTQLRLDEGVLGFDTQKSRKLNSDSRWVGVGRLPGDRLVVHSLTSSADNGDFSRKVAEIVGVMLGGDPVILVVKKNSHLLANLLKWILHVAGSEEAAMGRQIVRGVPLLLIDDEADNASINTKGKPGAGDADSVTAINGKIRSLLDAFEMSAYVGYTATPFANIFINPETEAPTKFGPDLFPRSFIINVKPPSNHIGPPKVFGLEGDPDAGIEGREGLPIVRTVADHETVFPAKHPKDYVPTELPESLRRAIRCFILTCAARRARGQDRKHNSMLVHVTRFVEVQGHVRDLVSAELKGLQRRIEMGDGNRSPTLVAELEALWQSEFAPTSQALGDAAGPAVRWDEVSKQLHSAAAKITVLCINGHAKDALDYKEHEADGCSVIAIGGDKLSRGLTLEGLSISYFLRTSRMYDTLLQMGRWFGYRPGYLDLCRLFTTQTLVSWYRHIALAEEELRREFDYMVASGLTPVEYGLRVRTHPDGMTVTALNKMCYGRTLELSWAGVLAQTTNLPKEPTRIAANLKTTEMLLTAIPSMPSFVGAGPRPIRVWSKVGGELVARFVGSLQFPPASLRASGEQLAAFIRKQIAKQPAELTSWTVALISNAQARAEIRVRQVAGFDVGLIERSPENQTETSLALRKANILSPDHEGLDFRECDFGQAWFDAIHDKRELKDDLEWLQGQVGQPGGEVARALTIRWQDAEPPKLRKPAVGTQTRANGRVLRVLRRPEHGLLLIYPVLPPEKVTVEGEPDEPTNLDPAGPPIIGVALSFPTSATVLGVEYRVNKVWATTIQDDQAYED